MPQHLGDDLRIDVARQQQRRARVAKAVKPYGRELGLFEKRLERTLPEVHGVYQRSPLGREQKALIVVESTSVLLLPHLASTMSVE